MEFRHEVKFLINRSDMIVIRQRLRAAAYPDPHTIEGKYKIRSLYFDNLQDKALMEKLNGVNNREKFRIRYYNGDLSYICLEKKSKRGNLGWKESALLTPEEAQAIADGHPDRMNTMIGSPSPLVRELYAKMSNEGLRGKTIVDYTREPFVYPAGNVRVTIDYDIRSGLGSTDFLNPDCVTVPVTDAVILEVKWDAFLPDCIRSAVSLESREAGAFSKYAACRIYG